MKPHLYIGVMTGTSADGIDICLISIKDDSSINIIANTSLNFSSTIKSAIKSLCHPGENELIYSKALGIELSRITASEINKLLKQENILSTDIDAIGFHGQTIRHQPSGDTPFTVQAGCGSTLAHLTQIDVITDFRMADIAAGGQGAPLVPAFHKAMLSSNLTNRIIVNIGGIANITYLPADSNDPIFGFDTGPGNTLMDEWIFLNKKEDYDRNGAWAKKGKVIPTLFECMLNDPYLAKAFPKSTGKEYFNLDWLKSLNFSLANANSADIQRTLLEFTCESITRQILPLLDYHSPSEVFICGGGAFNEALMQRINERLSPTPVFSTAKLGIHPQQVEACAFAWLAYRTKARMSGNLTSVTGAKKEKILGCIYPA